MQKLHEVVNPLATPQTERIPGRSDQTQNDAGGYGWTASSLSQLHRFLVLGSEGGTYYATERELTLKSYDALAACLVREPKEAIELIASVSESGRAPKNDPALFALAVAASHENPDVRALAYAALPRVARIGTHLFHFIEYLVARKSRRRGWGPSLRKAVARWYNDTEPMDLAYELEKYRSRDGWSHRDLIRLSHPTPLTFDHSWLYARAVGKQVRVPGEVSGELESWIAAVDMVGVGLAAAPPTALIRKHRLPREVIPTELLNSPDVWAALLEHMPMQAMVRNLATMTRVGLLAPMSDASRAVVAKLGDKDQLRKSRIHPMQILLALWTYAGGQSGQAGRGFGREAKTWTAVGPVIDALDAAFYQAFVNVEPTGKRTLLAIDGSGSMMGAGYGAVPFVPAQVAAAMAMVTARTEPQWSALLYDQSVYPFPDLTPRARLDQLIKAMPGHGCGTDGALPFQWALKAKVPVDIFLSYTDGQTWAGNQHPAQALAAYRQGMGINARAVQVQIVNNATSQSDPRDPLMLDCVGFDASVPEVIAGFARGDF